jgi:hypothetical protein
MPLNFIFVAHDNGHLWCLIKIWRIQTGLSLLDVTMVMSAVKKYLLSKITKSIKRDPSIADDTLVDHNNLGSVLMGKHMLNTLKIVVIILNIAYFLGIFWLIVSNISRKLILDGYDTASTNYFI